MCLERSGCFIWPKQNASPFFSSNVSFLPVEPNQNTELWWKDVMKSWAGSSCSLFQQHSSATELGQVDTSFPKVQCWSSPKYWWINVDFTLGIRNQRKTQSAWKECVSSCPEQLLKGKRSCENVLIIEWSGLEGTLEIIQLQTHAMGEDIFH